MPWKLPRRQLWQAGDLSEIWANLPLEIRPKSDAGGIAVDTFGKSIGGDSGCWECGPISGVFWKRIYLDHVGRGPFYGFLASLRGQLFRDQELVDLYCANNGRNSVAPSLLATALLLQAHDRVSDEEAKAKSFSADIIAPPNLCCWKSRSAC